MAVNTSTILNVETGFVICLYKRVSYIVLISIPSADIVNTRQIQRLVICAAKKPKFNCNLNKVLLFSV